MAGSVFRLKFRLFLGQCDLLINTKICVKDVRNFLHTIPVGVQETRWLVGWLVGCSGGGPFPFLLSKWTTSWPHSGPLFNAHGEGWWGDQLEPAKNAF